MNFRPRLLKAIAFCAYLIVVGGMLALIFMQSVSAAAERRQLLVQLAELEEQSAAQQGDHRTANQADHDCIVALALVLADPERPRDREIVPPPICRVAPAASHVSEEPK